MGIISPGQFWNYIWEEQEYSCKEILVVKFTSKNNEERKLFDELYSYLKDRNSFGVFDTEHSPGIKNFYVSPFIDDKVPFEECNQQFLIGIIVAKVSQKRKIVETPHFTTPPKMSNFVTKYNLPDDLPEIIFESSSVKKKRNAAISEKDVHGEDNYQSSKTDNHSCSEDDDIICIN